MHIGFLHFVFDCKPFVTPKDIFNRSYCRKLDVRRGAKDFMKQVCLKEDMKEARKQVVLGGSLRPAGHQGRKDVIV